MSEFPKYFNDTKGKKVFIKTIPRDTATRMHEFRNDSSGKKLNKTKFGNCKDRIQALYDRKLGALATGLNVVVDTEVDEKGHTKQILLQEIMEKKHGRPAGYYTNRSWRKGDSLKEEDLTYFQVTRWTLFDGTTVLDLNLPDDEIFYYVCLASKFVANSEKEWREHKWPKAMWYISHENEEESIKYKKNEIRSKAFARLHHEDMTDAMKKKFVHILKLVTTRDEITNEQAHNLLYDFIERSDFNPKSNIDKFNTLFEKLSTAPGREDLEARYLLQSLIDYRIVYIRQGTYYWIAPNREVIIGERESEAVAFITNPAKQTDLDEMEAQLKAKRI